MARLGASSAAHPVEPGIAAEAHGVEAPRPRVEAPGLSPEVVVRASAPLATAVRSCGPEGLATEARRAALQTARPGARRTAPGMATGAHGALLLRLAARRADPAARTRARAAGGAGAHRLRTVRRSRVPWPDLGRERLATAWGRVQTEHAGAGQLELVGVYGPVPIEALESVALDGDGRLAMTFGRRGLLGPRGDVALARVVATGRLVRCDVPHPSTG